jgi:hypothetical protein
MWSILSCIQWVLWSLTRAEVSGREANYCFFQHFLYKALSERPIIFRGSLNEQCLDLHSSPLEPICPFALTPFSDEFNASCTVWRPRVHGASCTVWRPSVRSSLYTAWRPSVRSSLYTAWRPSVWKASYTVCATHCPGSEVHCMATQWSECFVQCMATQCSEWFLSNYSLILSLPLQAYLLTQICLTIADLICFKQKFL